MVKLRASLTFWILTVASHGAVATVCSQAHLATDLPSILASARVAPMIADSKRRAVIQSKLSSYFTGILEQSKFVIQRTFPDYLGHLMSFQQKGDISLLDSLARLNADSHIIDLGAGRMNFAIAYATHPIAETRLLATRHGFEGLRDSVDRVIHQLELAGGPNLTAISLNHMDVIDSKSLAQTKKLRPMTGRYFENIPTSEIQAGFGKADLVIDLFGVFAYTLNLGLVTTKVAELMKPGGELWLKKDYCDVRLGRRTVSLSQFLQATKLFEIVAHPTVRGAAILLRRTSEPASELNVELADFEPRNSGIPFRLFQTSQF